MKICDECETVAHCTKHGCIPKVSAKDAMKLALEALETERPYLGPMPTKTSKAIDALREALAGQPAPVQPAYKDSTPHLSVGESSFESWYDQYLLSAPVHQENKQRLRDAYAAGMGDPLVVAAPVQQEPVAYWIPKAEQFCIADPSGRPFAKAWEPLYKSPPAHQEPFDKNGSPCPEFWDWLPKAYNFEGLGNFTKYNMEVAFLAGMQTTFPQAQRTWVSLTDDEIWREYRSLWPFHPAEERKLASDILIFARAIEAKHGIKENT